jgi:hypothetical protein
MRLRLGLLAAVWAAGPAWAATPPVEVETLRVGYSSADRPNLFKLGTWTPVWVQLRAGAAGFSGFMEVVVPDDDETPTAFRQRVEVPPRGSQRFVTYARPGSRDPEFTIRLLDPRGRRAAPDVQGATAAQLSPIQADETLILTLGKPQGVDQVPRLPGFDVGQNPRSAGQSEVTVAGVDALSGQLPGRWYGYDAASAVVLDTNDRRVMAEFDQFRSPALEDWVKRGGHLVVSVGSNWQAVRDSFLGPMLPAVPTGQEQVSSLEALDAYAGAGATKQITPPGSPKVMVTKLEEVEARGGKVLSSTSGLPLVVRGPYGFGRVTAIALDVDQKPFADWADRPLFWVKAIDLRRRASSDSTAAGGMVGGGRRILNAGVDDLASQLRRALEQFPGVRLVPFGWVAFFIFLYILLIGPGDYLFLKKVLKRMELTWVTFPIIVVTVSLLAYYAAYVVKGSELRVNKVEVVDVDQTSGLLRGSTWLNIFSPQNRDYAVSVVPLPLDRDVPAEAQPVRPAGTEVMVSWFGDPQPGFGGMGQGGRLGFSSGGYDYQPTGSAEWLDGVRIPIWSTKCLTARWFGPAQPVLEADLKPVGPNAVEGTVTNRLDVPLHDALLAYLDQVYELGTIAPNATVQVNLSRSPRHLSGLLQDRMRNVQPAQPWNNQGFAINRSDLLLALMFSGVQKGPTTAEGVMSNNPLHYLDLSGQLALGRPMLVARTDRPASRLVLGNAPSPPKVDQTTMLRVILPLNDNQPEAAPKGKKPAG